MSSFMDLRKISLYFVCILSLGAIQLFFLSGIAGFIASFLLSMFVLVLMRDYLRFWITYLFGIGWPLILFALIDLRMRYIMQQMEEITGVSQLPLEYVIWGDFIFPIGISILASILVCILYYIITKTEHFVRFETRLQILFMVMIIIVSIFVFIRSLSFFIELFQVFTFDYRSVISSFGGE